MNRTPVTFSLMLLLFLPRPGAAQDFSGVPGVVLAHQDKANNDGAI